MNILAQYPEATVYELIKTLTEVHSEEFPEEDSDDSNSIEDSSTPTYPDDDNPEHLGNMN